MTSPEFWGFLGLAATAVFGMLATWFTAQSQKRSTEIQSIGSQWADFTDRIMKRMDSQQAELDRVTNQLNRLQVELEAIRDRYWAVIQIIRKILVRHPNALDTIEIPKDIADDIK